MLRLLRQAHTLKGAARVVRLPRIAEIAHAMEDALTPYRGSPEAVTSEQIGRLLNQVDTISSEIKALDEPLQADPDSRPSAMEPFDRVRVGLAEMDALLSGVSETAVQLDGMRMGFDAVKQVEDRLAALEQQLAAAAPAARLHETVEEIRTALQHARQGLSIRADSTDREVAEVRGNIDRLRLLPTGLLYPPLERAVRDAAEVLGKHAAFTTSGREQRLESHVLSALGEALSHLVRNAVAHGIESPADRLARGKPSFGDVRLEDRAARRSNRIYLLRRRRRYRRGRGSPRSRQSWSSVRRQRVGTLGRARTQAYFLPGRNHQCTSLSEVAGRGIGLEVVREVADRFKGRVSVRTEAGVGTSIEIEVPLSLSSIRAILLAADDLLIWVPLEAVHSALRLDENAIDSVAGRESLVFEGRAIPFIRLAETMRRPFEPASRTDMPPAPGGYRSSRRGPSRGRGGSRHPRRGSDRASAALGGRAHNAAGRRGFRRSGKSAARAQPRSAARSGACSPADADAGGGGLAAYTRDRRFAYQSNTA